MATVFFDLIEIEVILNDFFRVLVIGRIEGFNTMRSDKGLAVFVKRNTLGW